MTINGGTIQTSDSKTFKPTSLSIGGDFQFTGTGNDTWIMPVHLAGATRVITQNASGDRSFSGKISNGGLTKSGSGTLTLSGANDYSGKTTVSQGILKLSGSGSIAASSGIEIASGAELDVSGLTSEWTVASGQKLSGAGTVKGSATVNGRHAPAGTQSVTGSLAYGVASIFEWDLNANSVSTGFDTISRTTNGGSVTIAEGAKIDIILGGALDFANDFWSVARTWTWAGIFPQFGTVGAFTNCTVTGATPSSEGSFSVDSGGVQWSPALIPEPTSALAGLLLTAGMLRRRR
jgi:autotransporter-associated beta strand protein